MSNEWQLTDKIQLISIINLPFHTAVTRMNIFDTVQSQLQTNLTQGGSLCYLLVGLGENIVAAIKCLDEDVKKDVTTILPLLPRGIKIFGIAVASANEKQPELSNVHLNALKSLFSCLSTNKLIVGCYTGNDSNSLFHVNKDSLSTLQPIEPVNIISNTKMNALVFSCEFTQPMEFIYAKGSFHDKLKNEIAKINKSLRSDATVFMAIQNNLVASKTNSTPAKSLAPKKPVDNLIPTEHLWVSHVANFTYATRESTASNDNNVAPYLYYKEVGDAFVAEFDVQVSALCYIPADATIGFGITELTEAICQQLEVIGDSMNETDYLTKRIVPCNFLPATSKMVIHTLYNLTNNVDSEDHLMNVRKALHERFGLPLDRPLLRSKNSIKLTNRHVTDTSSRIRDVHLKLGQTVSATGGKVYAVNGSYDYFHYMQDNFNDDGWGCAYRSMQTICSWFLIQQYTNLPVPSHKEIQKMLVEMGDKPRNFIGSSQWIGAIEISMCLNQLYGVDSNVVHCTSGPEIAKKVSDLIVHFQTNGTPIMIGGGVLAYTLLGIDYNESNGETKYLILDPHYTGSEDLTNIKSRGWCGWKSIDLFRKDSFYNLLLPQRPKMI